MVEVREGSLWAIPLVRLSWQPDPERRLALWELSAQSRTILSQMVRHPSRYVLLRGVALAAALSVATSGSDLPMCLSLVAQAAAPCQMHGGRHRHEAHPAAPASGNVLSQAPAPTCHTDAGALGCAAGAACPTSGPASAAWVGTGLVARSASRVVALTVASAFASYVAPPLSPPPQA